MFSTFGFLAVYLSRKLHSSGDMSCFPTMSHPPHDSLNTSTAPTPRFPPHRFPPHRPRVGEDFAQLSHEDLVHLCCAMQQNLRSMKTAYEEEHNAVKARLTSVDWRMPTNDLRDELAEMN